MTPWSLAGRASLFITNTRNSLKLESVMPSNHLLCRPLLPSIFLSFRVFSKESVLHIRWPKYWSFCFSISPSNDYSGFIYFRGDWFDLLAVQGTLKSLLQHHSSKASILSLFGPTLKSVPDYWKNYSFDYTDLCQKVMSLLFNTLSTFITAFLPKSKCLLIS